MYMDTIKKTEGMKIDLSVAVKAEEEEANFLLFFGVTLGHSDKEVEWKVVYWEIGDKGHRQGDGSSTRT